MCGSLPEVMVLSLNYRRKQMKKLTMVLTVLGLLAGIATFVFSQNLGYGISGAHMDGTKNWKCTTAQPTLWYTTVTKGQGPASGINSTTSTG
jgi:hypothetical protein